MHRELSFVRLTAHVPQVDTLVWRVRQKHLFLNFLACLCLCTERPNGHLTSLTIRILS